MPEDSELAEVLSNAQYTQKCYTVFEQIQQYLKKHVELLKFVSPNRF